MHIFFIYFGYLMKKLKLKDKYRWNNQIKESNALLQAIPVLIR